MSVQVVMQTDDDEGVQVDAGLVAFVPRIGETLYGPDNAPGPWIVTDVFWTRPFSAEGVQKAVVMVRLNEQYDTASEGDVRPTYSEDDS